MAQTIKLKRSATQNAVPTTSQLALGEVALNTYDGKMYIKKSVGGTESIVEIGGDATSSSGLDFTGNLNLEDNVRIVIGDGNDLQIYHDGSDSIINENGTGDLKVFSSRFRVISPAGEEMIRATADGAVDLYHNNSAKLATTSSGISVTGNISGSGGLGVSGNITVGSSSSAVISLERASSNYILANNSGTGRLHIGAGSELVFLTGQSDGDYTQNEKIRIDADGRLLVNTTSSIDNLAKIQVVGNSSSLARITLQDVDGTNQKTFFEQSGGGTRISTQDGTSNGFFTIGAWNGTASSDFVRVTSAGRVGIGTASPGYVLDVQSSVGGILARFKDTDSSHTGIVIAGDTNAGWVGNNTLATGEGIYYQSSINALRFYTNGAQRLRIDSSGNVGINETAPAHKLEVSGDGHLIRATGTTSGGSARIGVYNENDGSGNAGATVYMESSGWGEGFLYVGGHNLSATGGDFNIRAGSGLDLTFGNGTTEYARISGSGNFGIGNTSPSTKLDVAGAGRFKLSGSDSSSHRVLVESAGDADYGVYITSAYSATMGRIGALSTSDGGTDAASINFENYGQDLAFKTGRDASNAERVRITSTGNVGIGTTSPSQKLDVQGIIKSGGIAHPEIELVPTGSVGNADIRFDGTSLDIRSNSSGAYLTLQTSTTERLKITNTGNFEFNNGNFTEVGTISSGNITTTGYLRGPSTFTIDPATHGDDTGTVVIAGNLQVDGTTTTINSTTLTVDDKNITLASGSTNAAAANGAGITVDCGSGTDATLTYDGTNDEWDFNKNVKVAGSVGVTNIVTNKVVKFNGTILDDSIITDNGTSVGISLSSPSSTYKLDVGGAIRSTAAAPSFALQETDSSNQTWLFGSYSGTAAIRDVTGGTYPLQIEATTPSSTLYLESTGDVGIGTASPAHKLHVDGGAMFNTNTGSTPVYITRSGATDQALKIHVDDASVIFESAQDESLDNYGNFIFALDSGTTEPFFSVRKGTSSSNTLLQVDGGGNVGIGTASPQNLLHVDGGSIRLTDTEGMFIIPNGSSDSVSGNYFTSLGGGSFTHLPFVWRLAGANRMLLDTSGRLGIGTTSPSTQLHVSSTSTSTLTVQNTTNAGNASLHFRDENNVDQYKVLYDLPNNRAEQHFNGNGLRFYSNQISAEVAKIGFGTGYNTSYFAGRVGIGTSSPTHNLHIQNSGSAAAIKLRREDTADEMLVLIGSSYGYVQNTTGPLGLGGSNDDRDILIDTSGRVGIGTTSPGTKLHIADSATPVLRISHTAGTAQNVDIYNSGGGMYLRARNNTANGIIVFQGQGGGTNTEYARFQSTGYLGVGTTGPSRRLHVKDTNYNVARLERDGAGGGVALEFRNGDGNIWQIGNDGDEVLRFYYAGSNKFQITSSGAARFNSAFTLPTSDGSANQVLKTDGSGNVTWATEAAVSANTSISDADGDTKIQVEESSDEDVIRFDTAGSQRMVIDSGGNFGFGVDTPTSYFHVKKNSTGIIARIEGTSGRYLYTGTDSGGHYLEQVGTSAAERIFRIQGSNGSGTYTVLSLDGHNQRIYTNSGTKVGIGTSNPLYALQVAGQIYANGGGIFLDSGYRIKWGNSQQFIEATNSGPMQFGTGNAERMRIDASGNLLVGTTAATAYNNSSDVYGFNVYANGQIASSVNGAQAAYFNRQNSDGAIVDLRKDGASIGTIQTNSGRLDIQGASNTVRIQSGTSLMQVTNGTQITFETAGSERMRIADNGNVGIGTNSPQRSLDVRHGLNIFGSGGYTELMLRGRAGTAQNLGAWHWSIRGDVGGSNDDLMLLRFTGGNSPTYAGTSMHIRNDNGYVGIGTNTGQPSAHLHVKDATGEAKVIIQAGSNTSSAVLQFGDSLDTSRGGIEYTSTDDMAFSTNNMTEAMRIRYTGNVGIGTSSPGNRLEVKASGNDNGIMLKSTTNADLIWLHQQTTSEGVLRIYGSGGAKVIIPGHNSPTYFNNGNNFGIGTTSPGEKLHVSGGNIKVANTDNPAKVLLDDSRATAASEISQRSDGRLSLAAVAGSYGTTGIEILSTGNVGIGTTSPASKFDIYHGSTLRLLFTTTGGTDNFISSVNGANNAYTNLFLNGGVVKLGTGGSERMRIDSGGNVGIGSTSTSALRLNVVTSTANHIAAQIENSNTADSFGLVVKGGNDANDYSADFRKRDNTNIMRIRGDGNVGIGTTSPSYKLDVFNNTTNTGSQLRVKNSYASASADSIVNIDGYGASTLKIWRNGIEEWKLDRPAGSDDLGLYAYGGAVGGGAGVGLVQFWDYDTGNIGIGTTSPSDRLHVYENVNRTSIKVQNSNHSAKFEAYGTASAITTDASNGLFLRTSDINALHVDANRNVGIGKDDPDAKLQVVGSGTIGWSNLANAYILAGTTSYGIGFDNNELACKGTDLYFGTITANTDLIFRAGGTTQRMFIDGSNGNISIGTNTSPQAKLQVEELGIDTTTTTTSATTQVAVDTMSASAFRSARYTIQVSNTTDSTYHITEIILIHNGTTPGITEYGTVFTGSAAEATFDADISSGNVRLLATPASTDSMTFKVVRHSITV